MNRSFHRSLESAMRTLALRRLKMAWIVGPRQVGKTTLAKALLTQQKAGCYYNWDEIEFRRLWTKSPSQLIEPLLSEGKGRTPLVIFDEIHKARNWKNTLKGVYDRFGDQAEIIVTGSARLNVYKKGGDSLMGRYLPFRLHPLSLGELEGREPVGPDEALRAWLGDATEHSIAAADAWSTLREYGGFPEPFFAQSSKISRIWRRNRMEKLVREDLRDLSRLQELSHVETLAALLPERVAGVLSIPALREDLEVSYDTVKRWLGYLSELFYFFELKPFARSIPRSLKKEGKSYLWDWSEAPEGGPRFENMVASHLLKACHFWTDTGEGTFELAYLRDKQKREVDFLILRDRKPWLAVEAKVSDSSWSPHFQAFQKALGGIPCVQLVDRSGVQIRHRESPYPAKVMSASTAFRFWP